MNSINQNVLVESKTARDETLSIINSERIEYVFKKVKALILLPDNTHVTTEMASSYYEVGLEAINSLIKDHREELLVDGLKVLTGDELKSFKDFCQIKSRAKAITVIPRRAMLRIAMLLRDSEIAQEIRTYLLNVEENTDLNNRLISLSQNTNENIQTVINQNSLILSENEEIKTIAYNLINKVEEVLEQPLFKIYENSSNAYEKLLMEFTDIMRDKNYYKGQYGICYSLFNENFKNWTGVDFGKKKINNKNYWLMNYGLDIIKHFIYGIKQDKIILNKHGNWIDLNGVYNNKIELQKTFEEFDGLCAYCGKDGVIIGEHIYPKRSKYSSDVIYNIVPACSECNQSKGETIITEWYPNQSFYTKERYENIRQHFKKYLIK